VREHAVHARDAHLDLVWLGYLLPPGSNLWHNAAFIGHRNQVRTLYERPKWSKTRDTNDLAALVGGAHAYLLSQRGAQRLLQQWNAAASKVDPEFVWDDSSSLDQWVLRRADIVQWAVPVPLFFAEFPATSSDLQLKQPVYTPEPHHHHHAHHHHHHHAPSPQKQEKEQKKPETKGFSRTSL
jgi:hypothetical protein